MKMVKSLLLGCMAGMIACSAAYASDSPVSPTKMKASHLTAIPYEGIDGGTVLALPIKKGDKNAYIPMVMPILVAEGNGDITRDPYEIEGAGFGLYPDTQEGEAPACYLKPEYRVSEGAGLGVTADPFHGIDYDHGA